ncbi:MAG: FliI/YscN family ATPase [Bryobacteraceae bacterium]
MNRDSRASVPGLDTRIDFSRYVRAIEHVPPFRLTGSVCEIVGLLIESTAPAVAIGDFCEIHASDGRRVRVQAVGFRSGRVLSLALEETDGIQLGDRIVARPAASKVPVGPGLLGQVLDGFGRRMRAPGDPPAPEFEPADFYDLYAPPPGPLDREPIVEPLVTGIRAIDGLLPCGLGQRVGLFGGSGVGKSTLVGSMCRNSKADISVVALIGERNREVRAFLEDDLGPEGRRRSVVVVATSDRPALLRIRACFVALAVAEYFRDQGASVLLVMDSITRLAMAQREIGLSAGEPPSQKGYTPSVFQLLPRVFERAGNFRRGSITGFFTVLVEGDDFNEPIADAARSILDGHIVLSRQLGAAGHYPAIDILESISRLSSQVSTPEQKTNATKIRDTMAAYRRAEDLINLGAYAAGSNSKIDAAIQLWPSLERFLVQPPGQSVARDETLRGLAELAARL